MGSKSWWEANQIHSRRGWRLTRKKGAVTPTLNQTCQGSKVRERKTVHREADEAQRTLGRKTVLWTGSSLV